MEYIRNRNLPDNVYHFFQKLKNYLNEDNDIYVYGSIQRGDYFHGLSDIDISLFCENEYSAMNKMQHLLHANKNDFVKISWLINGKMVYGYKLKYNNPVENIKVEFAIFNSKFKKIVLQNQKDTLKLPIIIFCMLYLLKIFYYTIPITPKWLFKLLKRNIFYIGGYSDKSYLVIKKNNDITNNTNKYKK
jgi:predicted nucleotidyltransferase